MTNDFYNVNINRYNPAEHRNYAVNPYTPEAVAGAGVNEEVNKGVNEGVNEEVNNIYRELENYNFNEQSPEQASHSRLNALDSTIMVNESYHNLEDENLRTEYQINKLESELKSLDTEIERAKSINDYQKADILTMRKHTIESKLKELNANYTSGDVAAKISGDISAIFSNRKPNFVTKALQKCVNFMSSKVLPKISKKYNTGLEIKTALDKLETLNKNVDEIITTKMPYGEADERYDLLSNYLNRANVIHFNISKTVGTPTFFDTISSIDKEKLDLARKNSSNFGNMTSRPNLHHPTK